MSNKNAKAIKIASKNEAIAIIDAIKKYINCEDELKLKKHSIQNLEDFINEYNKNNTFKIEVDYYSRFNLKDNLSQNIKLNPIIINFLYNDENFLYIQEIYESLKKYSNMELKNIFDYLNGSETDFHLLLENMINGNLKNIYHITFKDVIDNFKDFNEDTRDELKKYLATINGNVIFTSRDPINAYSIDLYFNFKSSNYHIVKKYMSEYCIDAFLIKHSLYKNLKNHGNLNLIFTLLSDTLNEYDKIWREEIIPTSITQLLVKSIDKNYSEIIHEVMNIIISFEKERDNMPFEWFIRMRMSNFQVPSISK